MKTAADPAPATPVLRWAASVALLATLWGCAAPRQEILVPGERVAAPAMPAPAPQAATQATSTAGQTTSFSTQLATYTEIGFDDLPGWSTDNFAESWPAFLDSCKVLSTRGTSWTALCAKARQVNGSSNAAIRSFFENEFAAYQIRDDDRRPDGVVTGYFEPEISGSRRYGAPFIFPVYGEPDDMLFLDLRKVPVAQRKRVVAVRLDGRNVLPQDSLSTRDMGQAGILTMDLSAMALDTLDRKIRLRREGNRLLPYYTREEIETLGVPNARVLAFVDNPAALYEMQIQGSGRIRLREGGELLRLSYAEQNGHPFRPMLAQAANGKPASKVRTRGGQVELTGDDDADDSDDGEVRTRGFKLAKPSLKVVVAVPGQRVAGAAGGRPAGSGITDPSYIFFRENTASGGPVGALGVPLSAGRSIAVDPRSTPLGYPVFVSTRDPGKGTPMRRLTIAQDTGGAIRGAVRADYFFGNGQQAASQARKMKERGQLWLLLPRGMQVAGVDAALTGRTRGGIGGSAPALAQCLIPTDDLCVDDDGQ